VGGSAAVGVAAGGWAGVGTEVGVGDAAGIGGSAEDGGVLGSFGVTDRGSEGNDDAVVAVFDRSLPAEHAAAVLSAMTTSAARRPAPGRIRQQFMGRQPLTTG
jgi:hypothetical protein